MNTHELGKLAAEAMEEIEERYGEDATLLTAALVLEIHVPGRTDILVTSTESPREWVEIAFLDEALKKLEEEYGRSQILKELDADDDD